MTAAPYQKLNAALNDLDARGLLRPRIRQGLDLTVWSATHGTACLLVEGMLPPGGADAFVAAMNRLVLAGN